MHEHRVCDYDKTHEHQGKRRVGRKEHFSGIQRRIVDLVLSVVLG
jgi:hypothetical protein